MSNRKTLEYYECSICGKPYRTEAEANQCYQSHQDSKEQVRHRVQDAQPVYQSKIARKVDSGMKKIRGGVQTFGEVMDAINSNFDFDAAADNFAGGLSFGMGQDDEEEGEETESVPPRKLPNTRKGLPKRKR